MSFAAWGFLLALPLCGIPVLVHLWNREKPITVRWPLMQLLMETEAESRSARRLRDVLLMLLRILLVLLIVLAFSRPIVWISPGGLFGMFVPSSNVIVLDASMSMQSEQDGSSGFENAKQLAEDLARDLRGTRIELLLLTDRLESVADTRTDGFGGLRHAIREAQVTYRSADFTAALRTLGEQARQTGHPTDVYLVTDNQASGWRDQSAACNESLRKLGEHLRVSLVTPDDEVPIETESTDNGQSQKDRTNRKQPPAPTGNACVAELVSWPHEVADTEAPTQFRAEIANFGPAQTVDVQLRLSDSEIDSKQVELDPGGRKKVVFEHQFDKPGVYAVAAEISDERLQCDNRRWLAVDVPEPIPVICFDNGRTQDDRGAPSQTEFLCSFLSPKKPRQDGRAKPLFAPRTTELRELEELGESFRGVVVLANVEKLTEAQADKLIGMVESGTGVAIFLGPDVSVDAYNSQLFRDGWGLLPARLQSDAKGDELAKLTDWNDAWHVDTSFVEHPVFRYAGSDDQRSTMLRSVRFSKAFDVDDASLPLGSPSLVARFSNERPFVLEKSLDQGRVLLFTTSCDLRWGTLPLSNALVFVDRAFRYLAASQLPQRNRLAGQSIVYRRTATHDDATLTTPDRREVIVQPGHTDRGRPAYVHKAANEPGLYTLRVEDDPLQLFAVNVNVAESDLQRMTEQALRDTYPDFQFNWKGPGQAALTSPRPVETWILLACVALLAAVAEIFVAKRFEPSSSTVARY